MWRSSKTKQNERIPEDLWSRIFILIPNHTEKEVRSALDLTPIQMERGRRLVQESKPSKELGAAMPHHLESIDFCKAEPITGATVLSFNEAQTESTLSEEEWFAKEIREDELDRKAKNQPTKTPLVYKPAEAFSTATSVVEIRRPDGMLMSIHICTDRFEELLRAFFKG